MNPRAVAMQGLGLGALVVALQGLVPASESPQIAPSGGSVDQTAAFAKKGERDRERQAEADARSRLLKTRKAQAEAEAAAQNAAEKAREDDQTRLAAQIATEALRRTAEGLHVPLQERTEPNPAATKPAAKAQTTEQSATASEPALLTLAEINDNRRRLAIALLALG